MTEERGRETERGLAKAHMAAFRCRCVEQTDARGRGGATGCGARTARPRCGSQVVGAWLVHSYACLRAPRRRDDRAGARAIERRGLGLPRRLGWHSDEVTRAAAGTLQRGALSDETCGRKGWRVGIPATEACGAQELRPDGVVGNRLPRSRCSTGGDAILAELGARFTAV